ncbi:MAG TPA: pyrroline-5-carboxylate reductase [Stellaceae bacterium]|jgi:pyrroline-5-carboxylate reductase
MTAPLLLVGCGKMGGALLGGWLAGAGSGGAQRTIAIVEPGDGKAGFAGRPGVIAVDSADALDPQFRPGVVVLAVKPQMMDDVLPALRRFAAVPGTVFLSIAAGKTATYFETRLGDGGSKVAVIRAMPNTPAAVGRGITAAYANPQVTAAQRAECDALLAAVGEVVWVDDERLIAPVTALSGGGPAYVFLLIECLARAGAKAGLPADLAMRLARATVIGAGELARQSSEPASVLRQNVTSPGGTTQAALKVLMAETGGIAPLFDAAIAAATVRAGELAE